MTRQAELLTPAPPEHVRQGELLRADTVNSLVDSIGIRKIRQDPSRYQFRPARRIWDLLDLTITGFSIYGGQGERKGVQIAGHYRVVFTSDFNDYDYSTKRWTTGTVDDDSFQFVFVTLERSGPSPVLSAAPALPDSDDDTEIWPLWYLPWDAVNNQIDIFNREDLRDSIHLTAMA